MEKKWNDYGMLFERVVEKIWGKPKTPVTFASYYDLKEGNVILYVLCIYILNYQSPDDELKERIIKFMSSREPYLNYDNFVEMLEFFGEKYDL